MKRWKERDICRKAANHCGYATKVIIGKKGQCVFICGWFGYCQSRTEPKGRGDKIKRLGNLARSDPETFDVDLRE